MTEGDTLFVVRPPSFILSKAKARTKDGQTKPGALAEDARPECLWMKQAGYGRTMPVVSMLTACLRSKMES